MHYPQKQCSVNTSKATFMGQDSPSHSGEGKGEECNVVHDAADKEKASG